MMYPVLNNDWFDKAFNEFFGNRPVRSNGTQPAVNVKEDNKAYTMEIAVPGIKKDFCRVSLNDDGDLEVAIENKLEHHEEENGEEKKERYLRREFSYTNYQQSYSLPDDVDKEHISAKVENGILSITLPKMIEEPKAAGRQIEIG